MGFAVTRAQARQLVAHKAIKVNGKSVNLPSYQVKVGDDGGACRPRQGPAAHQGSLTLSQEMDLAPNWVEVDSEQAGRACSRQLPDRSDLPSDINENLIVELYSK
jgi:small subunit ribosomal protein S4